MPKNEVKKKRRSERGNWLVITYIDHEIFWCKWIQSWAGVQASKRSSEKLFGDRLGRILVLDIERMVDFSVTEAANEINDLYALFEK